MHALGARNPGEGCGGYSAYVSESGALRAMTGFVMGAAGIGLALLAAATTVEPQWDRLLLLSTR